MWQNPVSEQSFALCLADGTVLAELPPTIRIDSTIGPPEPKKPPVPQKAGAARLGDYTETVVTTANSDGSSESGSHKKKVTEIGPAPDYYTWERAPFSNVWFALGDGLPRERPEPPSTTTVITEENGKTVTETVSKGTTIADGKSTTVTETTTVTEGGASASTPEITITTKNGVNSTETVTKRATTLEGRPAVETVTTRHTLLEPGYQRYVVAPAYWETPTPLLNTDSIQAAYQAAYDASLTSAEEIWVLERVDGDYNVLERFENVPPQMVLTGRWLYDSPDDMLIHASEIERAVLSATQLVFRGQSVAQFDPSRTPLFRLQTAEQMRDVTYTLTLWPTKHITADELARRQLI